MGHVPWNFAIRSEAAVQTDPFEEEFFIGPSDSELDDGHVASLVRESVQNALDARVGAAPVRVTFALHKSRVRQTGALRYLAGLEPHLAALTPPVPWPLDGANDTIRWLVYEDFHTTGLCGDPAIVDDPPAGHQRREDFYWFWRNVGRSAKTGEKLGRWGLGKTVFPSSSNINCIIGLTRRSVVQSTVHECWARKHSMSLKQDLQYSPTDCFETFAFPEGLWQTPSAGLADIGERYHEHRRQLMLSLWLGLTDVYNLFHSREFDADLAKHFASRAKKDPAASSIPEEHRAGAVAFTLDAARAGIVELRRLHVDLDTAVRDAYGWQDLPLEHDFSEVETLPENDRVRYTISPAARKELLKRLLAENHGRAAAESAAAADAKPAAKTNRKRTPKRSSEASGGPSLFASEDS